MASTANCWRQVAAVTGCSDLPSRSVAGGAEEGSTGGMGRAADVGWFANGTPRGGPTTAAIPPVFEAYATVVLPHAGEGQDEHDRAVLALLSEQSTGQPRWLGYLDTGADDIVFPDAPKVTLYPGWHYVLVEAGPAQAATWRQYGDCSFWKGALPNLMFPADRSWLVSTLWGDDWSCIGGPAPAPDRVLPPPHLTQPPRGLPPAAPPPRHQEPSPPPRPPPPTPRPPPPPPPLPPPPPTPPSTP